jgi:hypothetical protein
MLNIAVTTVNVGSKTMFNPVRNNIATSCSFFAVCFLLDPFWNIVVLYGIMVYLVTSLIQLKESRGEQ